MTIQDLITKFYIQPIVQNEGYNVVNTLTYAILVVIATYLTYRFLEKLKVKIDKNFVLGFFPWIVFGTAIRVFVEAGVYQSYFLVTPMIWIETFALVFVVFLISKFVEKKFNLPYYKTLFTIGVLSLIIPFVILLPKIIHFDRMLLALGLLSPIAIILYLVKWFPSNKLVALAHTFDAISTFTAVQFFGFRELHVFSNFLIGNSGPITFVVAKLIVVVGVLILIDKYSDDKNFNNYLKFIIGIIGFAPGLRDFYLLGIS